MVAIETCNDVTANLWKRLCLAAFALFLAVPAAAGASAVTGSRSGHLPIMDAETGQVLTISQDTIPRFFAAQCLKDNTMAESIDSYARAHGGHLVFHVTGAAHCEGWLGTVEQLHQRNPGLTIRVITAVHYDPSRLSRSEAAALYRDKGDYLILVPEAMADTGSRG